MENKEYNLTKYLQKQRRNYMKTLRRLMCIALFLALMLLFVSTALAQPVQYNVYFRQGNTLLGSIRVNKGDPIPFGDPEVANIIAKVQPSSDPNELQLFWYTNIFTNARWRPGTAVNSTMTLHAKHRSNPYWAQNRLYRWINPDDEHTYHTGWYSDGTNTYYFIPETGVFATRIFKVAEGGPDDGTYFFNPATGVKQTGIQISGGKHYFFDPTANGQLAPVGWHTVNGFTLPFTDEGGALKFGMLDVDESGNPSIIYITQDYKRAEGWTRVAGQMYYFDPANDHKAITSDFFTDTIDGTAYTFYFDDKGIMATGWRTIGADKHFFDNAGRMLKGYQNIGGKYYLFDNSGKMQTGWHDINADGIIEFFHEETGMQTKGLVYDSTKPGYIFIEQNNTLAKGWKLIAGKKFYFDESNNSVAATDFTEIQGKTYYFNAKGEMQTSWIIVDGKKYYLDPATGERKVGLITLAGKTYYLQDTVLAGHPIGSMRTGWVEIKTIRYFFDDNGVQQRGLVHDKTTGDYYFIEYNNTLASGWRTVAGKRYYFDSMNASKASKAFKEIDGKHYYFHHETAVMLTGIQKINETPGNASTPEHEYLFLPNGIMHTGLYSAGGKVFYYYDGKEPGADMTKLGRKQTGAAWHIVDGTDRLPFDDSGALKRGFVEDAGDLYYIAANNKLARGWTNIFNKRYYFDPANGKAFKGGDFNIEGKIYRFNINGEMFTGWLTEAGEKYYYGPTGELYTGLQTILGKTYYFDPVSGRLAVNQKIIDGDKVYIMDADGVVQRGLVFHSGDYFFVENNNTLAKGWKNIGGRLYHFDVNGVAERSFVSIDGRGYYFNTDGLPYAVVGWMELGGSTYYFGSDGKMFVGLQNIGGNTFFFDESSGEMQKGWTSVSVNGETYDLLFADSGALMRGLVERVTGGVTDYYFIEANNKLAKGWKNIGSKRYFFAMSDGKAFKNGPHMIVGNHYLFDDKGVLYTGWRTDGAGDTYYHQINGIILKGLQFIAGKTFYFDPATGKMQKGWHTVGTEYLLFDNITGELKHGFVEDGADTYYIEPNNKLAKGWKSIAGKRYFFDFTTGEMYKGHKNVPNSATDPTTKEFYFDEKGALVVGWVKYKSGAVDVTYFYYADGRKAKGMHTIYGRQYYFKESGADEGQMQFLWHTVSGIAYYFDPNAGGALVKGLIYDQTPGQEGFRFIHANNTFAKGWLNISGKLYYFDPTDALLFRSLVSTDFTDPATGREYYFTDKGHAHVGFLYRADKNATFYYNGVGVMLKGLQTMGTKTYYFDKVTGAMQTGWHDVYGNGVQFFFDADGALKRGLIFDGADYYFIEANNTRASGWKFIWGHAYYFDPVSGAAYRGFHEINGLHYYFGDDAKMFKGWQTIGTETYFFLSNGVRVSGWQNIGGNRYHFDTDGKMTRGFVNIDGFDYFFGDNGALTRGLVSFGGKIFFVENNYQRGTGWKNVGGKRYYFDDITGEAAQSGRFEIDGKIYHFGDDGVMHVGWLTEGDKKFYFNPDGTMAVGALSIAGKLYYFSPDPSNRGEMQTGWISLLGLNFFFDRINGYAVTGFVVDGEDYYYINSNRTLFQGLRYVGGKLYYFGSDGKAVKNDEVAAEGDIYYFGEDATAFSGWRDVGSNRFYYSPFDVGYPLPHKRFAMVRNRAFTIGGNLYYFEASGAMVTGWKVINGIDFYFGEDGAAQKGLVFDGLGYRFIESNYSKASGWKNVGGKWYYFDPTDNYALIGLQTGYSGFAAGDVFHFNEQGQATFGWETVDGKTYYFLGNMAAYKGARVILGKSYYFDPVSSVLQKDFILRLGSKVFYYNSEGVMTKGLIQYEGKLYFIDVNDTFAQGWKTINENKYYFMESTDPNIAGIAAQGITLIAGKYHYFDENGVMQKGFHEISGDLYYFDENGVMVTEPRQIGPYYYDIAASGIINRSGWNAGETMYYDTVNGRRAVGFTKIGDATYYFNNDGIKQEGWLSLNGDSYYLQPGTAPTGQMATKWLQVDGLWRWFGLDGKHQAQYDQTDAPDDPNLPPTPPPSGKSLLRSFKALKDELMEELPNDILNGEEPETTPEAPTDEQTATVKVVFKNGSAVYKEKTLNKGDVLDALTADPTMDGKVFLGWYIMVDNEEVKYEFGRAVNEDIELFAKWADAPQATVEPAEGTEQPATPEVSETPVEPTPEPEQNTPAPQAGETTQSEPVQPESPTPADTGSEPEASNEG